MKNSRIIFVIYLMVVTTMVAFVSCKKENQESLLNTNQTDKSFSVPQVDDMNTYLKDFKQKMLKSQTSKEAEYLCLEEAAWYLSSVANYDFANVNVKYTDLRYDTLYYQINVINNQVALSDLSTVYESMSSDISDLYQSLDLLDKQFRFIGTSISNTGIVTVEIMTSYTILDHTWYFHNDYYFDTICYYFFSEDSTYVWNGLGKSELERVINLLQGHNYILPGETPGSRIYYVYSTEVLFHYDYNDCIDPYGSPFYIDSRLFAAKGDTYYVPIITFNAMVYCLDSYIGLMYNYAVSQYFIQNIYPVKWSITPGFEIDGGWHIYYHDVTITLGQLYATNDPIQP